MFLVLERGLEFGSGCNESELSLRYSEMCNGTYFSTTQELFWVRACIRLGNQ